MKHVYLAFIRKMMRTNPFIKSLFLLIFIVLISTFLSASSVKNPFISRSESDVPPGTDPKAALDPIFTYQGFLRESGVPVTGSRDMVFRFFENSDCTSQIRDDMVRPDVNVVNGLFSVILDAYFTGSAVYLSVEVEGTAMACQPILGVPYAFSLYPGATIMGERVNWDGLHVVNTATEEASYGIYGQSLSPNGVGVYAMGVDSGPDIILGGNAETTTGDDGVLSSSKAYPSSDLIFETNDGFRFDMDTDGNGEDADFEIRNKDNDLIFNVDESGDMTYGGDGIAAYPRPSYDSGWQTVGLGATKTLTHNLGGNADNYVVDMTFKSSTDGVNNWGHGSDQDAPEYYGAHWFGLTNSEIRVKRWDDDTAAPQVRIRIWMYT